jgi:hypothetical protein
VPLGRWEPTSASAPAVLEASTVHVATSVAPFQLAYTTELPAGFTRAAAAGLSVGCPVQAAVKARRRRSATPGAPGSPTSWPPSNSACPTSTASVGGLGGCPYAPGATGNIATEELVHMVQDMGVATGIDLEAMIEAAAMAEGIVGRPLSSQVLRAGPRSRRIAP